MQRLNESESFETALRRLAVESIDTAIAALDGAEGRDIAIHTVRKESKRSRAILRLFSVAIGPGWQRERQYFRDLARSLSAARDARVVLDVHAALTDRFGGVLYPAAGATVRQQLIADIRTVAEESGDSVAPDLESLRLGLAAARLRARRWVLTGTDTDAFELGFVRTYRRARAAARAAEITPHSSNFHELRKRAKEFWYQLEIVARRWPDTALRRIAPTRRLTELLGEANDLAVYAEATRRAAAVRYPEAAEVFVALADRRRAALEAEAAKLCPEIFSRKPRRFAAELGRREHHQQAAG